jgi:hypothetical protein
VISVKGRKFLGYSFWFAKDGVKRKVATKPMAEDQATDPALGRDAAWRGCYRAAKSLSAEL